MDAAIRDAERAAATGDPLEAERLAGLRARTVVAPPRRQKTDDLAERGRIDAGYTAAQAAYERLRRAHDVTCSVLAEAVREYLAPRKGEGKLGVVRRKVARERMVRLSEGEVEDSAAADAAWAHRCAWHHASHLARHGTCPQDAKEEERAPGSMWACAHPFDAAGRCAGPRRHAPCPCGGCSGAL